MEQAYDDGWNAAGYDANHDGHVSTNPFDGWGEWAGRLRATWAQGYTDAKAAK